jgi:hypothetical protein
MAGAILKGARMTGARTTGALDVSLEGAVLHPFFSQDEPEAAGAVRLCYFQLHPLFGQNNVYQVDLSREACSKGKGFGVQVQIPNTCYGTPPTAAFPDSTEAEQQQRSVGMPAVPATASAAAAAASMLPHLHQAIDRLTARSEHEEILLAISAVRSDLLPSEWGPEERLVFEAIKLAEDDP